MSSERVGILESAIITADRWWNGGKGLLNYKNQFICWFAKITADRFVDALICWLIGQVGCEILSLGIFGVDWLVEWLRDCFIAILSNCWIDLLLDCFIVGRHGNSRNLVFEWTLRLREFCECWFSIRSRSSLLELTIFCSFGVPTSVGKLDTTCRNWRCSTDY